MWWLSLVAGCAFISMSEHEKNQEALEALLETDTDADADADADTDTDTDTDADTDPVGCIDDAEEENDTVLTAKPLDLPSNLEASLCPEDIPLGGELPVDVWYVDVPELYVLRANLGPSGETECQEQSLVLTVTDDQEIPFPDASTSEPCGGLEVGWASGRHYVWVTGDPGAQGQQYSLSLSIEECTDSDDDGFMSINCGGPDCADTLASRYPGAADPTDGTDQDCDGGDDLAPSCTPVSVGAGFEVGTLGCGDLDAAAVWDRWEIFVAAGSDISVVAQNDADGAADLLAMIVDANGTAHYGLDEDRTQLDDENDCAITAWTGALTACPSTCLSPVSDGPLTIFVAQHPGSGCTNASYSLLVYVDGEEADPSLVQDDAPLEFPIL